MAKKKKPMRLLVLLDWCDYTCPCGATLSMRFTSEAEAKAWVAAHKPHTNGRCVEHWDAADTLKVMSEVPPDREYKL